MPQRKGTYSIPLQVMKAYRNSGRGTPLTLNLITSRMWLVSITPWQFHPQERKPVSYQNGGSRKQGLFS